MRPRRDLTVISALLAALSFTAPAGAQVCAGSAFELAHQPQDYTNGFKSDASGNRQVVADQVVVPAGTVLERVTVWGGFDGNNASSGFDLWIHEDAGGLPGAVVYSELGVAATLTLTGMTFPPPLIPLNEYELTLTPAAPVSLPAGTLWFEVYNSDGNTLWYWLTGTVDPDAGVVGAAIAFSAPGTAWSPFNPDMAMALCGFQADTGNTLCFGDGSGGACPCGNEAPGGGGCANSTGVGGMLTASGSASIAAGDLVLSGASVLPGQPALFFQGDQLINGGDGAVFGDGLRCCGQGVVRLEVVVPDAGGDTSTSVDVGVEGGVAPGDTRCYQLWYRDPNGSPCGSNFNLTNALRVTWVM